MSVAEIIHYAQCCEIEPMGVEFASAVSHMNTLAADQQIRSCVVTGSGNAFSAGGDLAWLRERHDATPYQNRLTMLKFYNLYLHIRTLTVPTIAAINGHAIGAGMCMTLGCDFRIASKDARLGFTFVKLGIHPGMWFRSHIYQPGCALTSDKSHFHFSNLVFFHSFFRLL